MRKLVILAIGAGTLLSCSSAPDLQVRSIAAAPASGMGSLEQGIALLRSGNVSMAIEVLHKAARRDPASLRTRNALGVAYDQLGRYDLSRQYYEEALALEPGNADVLHNLAASLTMQGRRAEAIAVALEERDRRTPAPQQIAAPTSAALDVAEPSAVAGHPRDQDRPAAAGAVRVAAPAPDRLSAPARGMAISVPLPPPAPFASSLAVSLRGSAIEVALPPPPARAARSMPLRIVNCVGRRGMARRLAAEIAARGWTGAQLLDDRRRRSRSVLVLPLTWSPRMSGMLQSLEFHPLVIRHPAARMPTLLLGTDALAFDRKLVRLERS